jgi:solute carrier family 5 (high affinity choline transporter), member 7
MVEEGVVLFPFRTLASLSAFIMIFIVSELTKTKYPPRRLLLPEERKKNDVAA